MLSIEEFFHPHDRILAACSGGPDSVALLFALKEIEKKMDLKVFVGHVNHRLRGREADSDERFVRSLTKRFGWRFQSQRISLKSVRQGNLEEWARVNRYEQLVLMAEKLKCSLIVTAHNLDDQVETILMNIFRGSGFSGLGGMPYFRTLPGTKVRICRPFLGISKSEIKGYLEKLGGTFRIDRMNQNPEFMRNWIRTKMVPEIEKRFSGFRRRLGHFSEIVREEEAQWNKEIKAMSEIVLVKKKGGALLDWDKFSQYSLPLQRRFLKQVIGPDLLSFDNLENLRKWMGSPPSNGLIWQLRKGWYVERLSKSKGSPSARIFWVGNDGFEREFLKKRAKQGVLNK